MLRQAENKVFIEGTLAEIKLNEGTYKKNGSDMPYIGGQIILRVEQEINKEMTTLDIPVHVFANKFTNAGKENPAYTAADDIMKKYNSILAVGEDDADHIRVSGKSGHITVNDYWPDEDRMLSFPQIQASFFSKINKHEFNPKAEFDVEGFVYRKTPVVDADGIETGALKVDCIVPKWGGKVDVIPFVAMNENVVNAISQYWTEGDTVKIRGKINFSSKTEVIEESIGFGEPIRKNRTTKISELVITGGSEVPLEGEFAFDREEIKQAMNERSVFLEEKKAKDLSKTKTKSSPAQTGLSSSLGF